MIEVGVALQDHLFTSDGAQRRRILDHVVDAGLDHVSVADHISFHGGTGFDGLVSAACVL